MALIVRVASTVTIFSGMAITSVAIEQGLAVAALWGLGFMSFGVLSLLLLAHVDWRR